MCLKRGNMATSGNCLLFGDTHQVRSESRSAAVRAHPQQSDIKAPSPRVRVNSTEHLARGVFQKNREFLEVIYSGLVDIESIYAVFETFDVPLVGG